MLEVLRHQCTINTLLMTCVTSQHAAAGRFDIFLNVFAELPVKQKSISSFNGSYIDIYFKVHFLICTTKCFPSLNPASLWLFNDRMLTPWLSVSIYPTTLTRLNYLWITLSLGVSARKRFQHFESTAACFYQVCFGFVYTGCKPCKPFFFYVCFLTVLVNICDSHQIRCTLCGAGIEDGSLDEYISDVMKRYVFISGDFFVIKLNISKPIILKCIFSSYLRSMSIPETLNELHRKLGKIPKSLPPPCHQANNNLLLSPGATGSETSSNLPHSAPAADKIPPGSACNATSGAQPLHEINIRATDSPFQACPVDAAPDWSSVSHLPERVWSFHLMT